ncbi:unnamed protein product [Macrosiphum euphorbiae]|uniref:Secreted protein n=1 Tax=Macrosiphum euphorbiae TaxID=13131 RepID=A0AAV0W690_9HEMI|nr:unnamed protein product [Macrosiphum euphorbiae]
MCGGTAGGSPSGGRARATSSVIFFRSTVTAHAATDGIVGTLAVWRAGASVPAGISCSLLGSRGVAMRCASVRSSSSSSSSLSSSARGVPSNVGRPGNAVLWQ